MGKISEGVYGGLSGKTGNLVGASWRGIDYVRINSQSRKNPRTDGQQIQRAKFALIAHTHRTLNPFLDRGFKNEAVHKTGANAAFSYNLLNAVTATTPTDAMINWELFRVSRGTLPAVQSPSATSSSGTIAITWVDNSEEPQAHATDLVMPVLYNPTKGYGIYGSGATRITGELDVAVPTSWIGDACVVFVAVFAAGSDLVSDSTYLGELVVI